MIFTRSRFDPFLYVARIFFGHTHRPNVHNIESSKRIVFGDWGEYGWLLTINEQEFNLEKFPIA